VSPGTPYKSQNSGKVNSKLCFRLNFIRTDQHEINQLGFS
jgi:hypothetical protein